MALAFTVFVLAQHQQYNLPETLAITDEHVLKARAADRERCKLFRDKNDTLERARALKFGEYRTLAKNRPVLEENAAQNLERVAGTIVFSFGTMAAVLPLLIWLPYALYHDHYYNFRLIYPPIRAVTYVSLGTFIFYYGVLEQVSCSECLEISGHWFTYASATFAFTFTLAHLVANEEKGVVGALYLAYFGFYQAFALLTLKSTQLHYHDSFEARTGIQFALLCLPISAIVIGFFYRLPGKLRDSRPPHEDDQRMEIVYAAEGSLLTPRVDQPEVGKSYT